MRLGILTTNDAFGDFVFGNRAQRLKNFKYLVTNRIGFDYYRRFHGYQSNYLHQVVLHHVAHGARVIVITATILHAKAFSRSDFNVVNEIMVPYGFENTVRKAGYRHVLHGFFAQIMVDAVYLFFSKIVQQVFI